MRRRNGEGNFGRIPQPNEGRGKSIIDQAGALPIAGPELRRHLRRSGFATSLGGLSDVDFDTAAPTDEQALVYNATIGAWVPGDAGAGGLVLVEVRNETGAKLDRNAIVYASGSHSSGKPLVALADADDAAKMPALGFVQADIADNAEGHVVAAGVVSNLALPDATYDDGDPLYVSGTAGGFTKTRPAGSTQFVQQIAVVSRLHDSNGWAVVMGAGRVNDQNNQLVALLGVSSTTDTTLGATMNAPLSSGMSVKTALNTLAQDLGVPRDDSVSSAKIADDAVSSAKIADDAVTLAKIADATLVALAGVATGADKVPYSTGTDTFSQATLTSLARTLIAATTAEAMRQVIDVGNTELHSVWFEDYLVPDTDALGWSKNGSGGGFATSWETINDTSNATGAVELRTGTGTSGRYAIFSWNDSLVFNNETAYTFESRINLQALSDEDDEYNATFGFSNKFNRGAGTETDYAYWIYRRSVDGDYWVAATARNGTETKTVTTTAPVGNDTTFVVLKIVVPADGASIAYYIDGVQKASHESNIPTNTDRMGIGFRIDKTAGTTERELRIDWHRFTTTRTTAR